MSKQIKLNISEFMKEADEQGLKNDTQIAAKLGISVTQLWRVKLPESHPQRNTPGTSFIAGVLSNLGGPFERFFFLD